MKFLAFLMKLCFVAPLSMCVVPGDFCDIAKPQVYRTDDVVRFMVRNDPNHVRQDIAENEYGLRNCKNAAWVIPSQGSAI